MVAVVESGAGPGTTAAYARAVIGLLPGFRPGGSALPDVEHLHHGVLVDRGHLVAYNRVCGFRLTDTLPATYPHVLGFPLAMRVMTAPDFPLPLIGLVHVANRITVHRPIDAGDPLDLSVRATALHDHPRGRQFDVTTTATVDGEQVWHGVSTYLRLSSRPPSTVPASSGPPSTAPASSGPVASAVAATGAAVAGSAVPGSAALHTPSVWRVPARVGADYAAVSGDRNPIHTSRLGARLFGFPGPIAHGMWTKARALAALEGRLPDAYTVDVTFRKPLPLPTRATFTAAPSPDGWTFTVASRHPHLTGTLTRSR